MPFKMYVCQAGLLASFEVASWAVFVDDVSKFDGEAVRSALITHGKDFAQFRNQIGGVLLESHLWN